jgi:hypothetical protein
VSQPACYPKIRVMGSRIRTVLAAAVPDRWRPQRPQTRSDSSGAPTDLDNGTGAGGLGSLHGHLEPASSSQFYPSPRGSSSSSSPTRLRHDSLLNSVPEEEGVTPPPPEDDNELVNEYDEDEVEWELEQMGLYRGEHSTLHLPACSNIQWYIQDRTVDSERCSPSSHCPPCSC